ncbi:MAG TPA: hypothetical protein VIG99_22070 [Myxococcaceae bacterium]
MRVAALLVGVGLMGCATVNPSPAPAPAAPNAPVKKEVKPGKNEQNEVVVIGKKQAPIPGLRSTDQETEFTIFHGKPYRCTKVKGSPEDPKGVESCRALNTGKQGTPITGLIDRYSGNIDSSDRH